MTQYDQEPSLAEMEERLGMRRSQRPQRRRASVSTAVIVVAAVLAVVVLVGGGLLVRAVLANGAKKQTAKSAVTKSASTSANPTAVFAHVSKAEIPIHFPASPEQMIAVGFHQAYNAKAAAFEPTIKMLRIYKPAETKQMLTDSPSTKLFEEALRYRGSSPRSAADCAVVPDATILSPVTGTVTLLKHYKLEGRIDDLQLEIQPDGASQLRVVMIHIKDVTVKVGDRVVGGVTPVATVRHLTLDSSVNRYLPVSPADHTHVQVNDQRYRLPSS